MGKQLPECHKTRQGAIADQVSKFVFLAIMTVLPLTGAYIISLARADLQKTAELAAKTKIAVLNSTLSGMAWVQARLEPAASETFLVCSGHRCLWKQHETRKEETESVYSDGKWTKKKVTRVYRDPPETVPGKLVASDTEIILESWKNFEMSEVLQEGSHLPAEADPQTRNAAPDPSKRELVYYLPAGCNAWVFGNFVNGRPVGTEEMPVRLSAAGREQFVEKTLENQGLLKILQTILSCVGAFFALVTLLIMVQMGKASLTGRN